MTHKVDLLLIAAFILACLQSYTAGQVNSYNRKSDEVRLVQQLLSDYEEMGRIARPVLNSSEILTVKYGMRLIQIDMDEKEQLMKTSSWIRARWIDAYLRWNPDEFGGLKTLVLPWDQIWTPDIALVNTADTEVEVRPSDVMVTHDGTVYWSPHRNFKSACLVDVTDFPYDTHACHLWFQSMARFGWQMDLQPVEDSPFDLETYLASFKESQEWEVLSNSTQRYEETKEIGVYLKFSRRVSLRFSLVVKRRPGFKGYLLMQPAVFLACTSVVVFCLPPERPDRHTLALSLFASYLVLLLILVEVAPPTASAVPLLGKYYSANITLIMCSVFLSALVIYVSKMGERRKKVPWIVKLVFIDILARPLLLHKRLSESFKAFPPRKPSLNRKSQRFLSETQDMEAGMRAMMLTNEGSRIGTRETSSKRNKIIRQPTRSDITDPEQKLSVDKVQWRNVALVMDRLFVVIYAIVLTIIFILFYPRP